MKHNIIQQIEQLQAERDTLREIVSDKDDDIQSLRATVEILDEYNRDVMHHVRRILELVLENLKEKIG